MVFSSYDTSIWAYFLSAWRNSFNNSFTWGGGTCLAAQWLKLCVSTAGVTGSVLGQGLKILHAAKRGQKKGGNPLLGSTGYKLVVYSPLQIFVFILEGNIHSMSNPKLQVFKTIPPLLRHFIVFYFYLDSWEVSCQLNILLRWTYLSSLSLLIRVPVWFSVIFLWLA